MAIVNSSFLLISTFVFAMCGDIVAGFAPSTTASTCRSQWTTLGTSKAPMDDDITRLQLKARQLLEKSKAKLASKGENGAKRANGSSSSNGAKEALPFFATAVKVRNIIKSRNEETGLVTADGERMAALSEEEEWEARSLLEVFENEMDENEDVYSLASQQLASRDVAASIFDLRKSLQTDDYKKIFNKRNPFIGEDN